LFVGIGGYGQDCRLLLFGLVVGGYLDLGHAASYLALWVGTSDWPLLG
jgi:hypothetical protein